MRYLLSCCSRAPHPPWWLRPLQEFEDDFSLQVTEDMKIDEVLASIAKKFGTLPAQQRLWHVTFLVLLFRAILLCNLLLTALLLLLLLLLLLGLVGKPCVIRDRFRGALRGGNRGGFAGWPPLSTLVRLEGFEEDWELAVFQGRAVGEGMTLGDAGITKDNTAPLITVR